MPPDKRPSTRTGALAARSRAIADAAVASAGSQTIHCSGCPPAPPLASCSDTTDVPGAGRPGNGGTSAGRAGLDVEIRAHASLAQPGEQVGRGVNTEADAGRRAPQLRHVGLQPEGHIVRGSAFGAEIDHDAVCRRHGWIVAGRRAYPRQPETRTAAFRADARRAAAASPGRGPRAPGLPARTTVQSAARSVRRSRRGRYKLRRAGADAPPPAPRPLSTPPPGWRPR